MTLATLAAAAAALLVPAQALAAANLPAGDGGSHGEHHAAAFETGNWSSCMLDDGAVYCWGLIGGQPGMVDTHGVPGRLTQLAVGAQHACGLTAAGRAYCWGDNYDGQLGNGGAPTTYQPRPVPVDTHGVLAGVRLVQLSADGFTTCALSSTGRAYCWGYNGAGALGDGTTVNRFTPVAVDTRGVLAGVRLRVINTQGNTTCALSSTGRAYCWGYNESGGVGNGTTTDQLTPVQVDTQGALAGVRLTQIVAGEHSCALSVTGRMYCWGRNGLGQVGDGTTTDRHTPVRVSTGGALAGVRIAQITEGYLHTCVLSAKGRAYCWGDNSEGGELGDGSGSSYSDTAVAVDTSGALGGVRLATLVAASFHTCALSTRERAYCWGYGDSGAIGQYADAPTPVEVTLPDSFRHR